jgi:hypothetical protein
MTESSQSTPKLTPSLGLSTAALCGLFALSSAVACGDDSNAGAPPAAEAEAGTGGQPASGETGGGAAGAPRGEAGAPAADPDVYDNVLSEGVPISAEEFQALCDERDGWSYTLAACAGAALCKGLSLTGDVLTDHSCKGVNSCAGFGCVVPPKDTGLTGEEIYRDGPCSGCHGSWADYENPNLGVYTVWHGWNVSPEAAIDQFKNSSEKRLLSILAFGTQGLHPDGTAYSNMPAYSQKYSLAELKRTLEYIQSLPTEASAYEVPGAEPYESGAGGAGGQPGAGGTDG